MKAHHRRWHAVTWLLLAPLLLVGIYLADAGRLDPAPAVTNPPAPSAAGVLP